MTVILNDGKLTLSGYVGDSYFGDGFTHSEVVVALAQIDDAADLTVHLNSGGGIATEGSAIHAALSARSGTTNVVIDGIAASAASLIAMAGDMVTMSIGSTMMIHDPSAITLGTIADHLKTVEGLEALSTSYARVYASKSGMTADECRAIMREETWFTPDQAIEAGFADETSGGKAKAVAAFDYRAYAHAPRRLVAMASKRNWSCSEIDARAPAARSTGQQKETPMSDPKSGGDKSVDIEAAKSEAATEAVQADRARRAAIMALDEAKGRDALAAHFADNTDDDVEKVKAALSVAPKAEADGKPKASLADRVNADPLGAASGDVQPKTKARLDASEIYASRRAR